MAKRKSSPTSPRDHKKQRLETNESLPHTEEMVLFAASPPITWSSVSPIPYDVLSYIFEFLTSGAISPEILCLLGSVCRAWRDVSSRLPVAVSLETCTANQATKKDMPQSLSRFSRLKELFMGTGMVWTRPPVPLLQCQSLVSINLRGTSRLCTALFQEISYYCVNLKSLTWTDRQGPYDANFFRCLLTGKTEDIMHAFRHRNEKPAGYLPGCRKLLCLDLHATAEARKRNLITGINEDGLAVLSKLCPALLSLDIGCLVWPNPRLPYSNHPRTAPTFHHFEMMQELTLTAHPLQIVVAESLCQMVSLKKLCLVDSFLDSGVLSMLIKTLGKQLELLDLRGCIKLDLKELNELQSQPNHNPALSILF